MPENDLLPGEKVSVRLKQTRSIGVSRVVRMGALVSLSQFWSAVKN